MKRTALIFGLLGLAVGWGAAEFFQSASGPAAKNSVPAANAKSLFRCPMHPWVKSDHAGQCTLCGMDLMPATLAAANHSTSGGPVVLLSPDTVKILGVQTALVKRQPLVRTLRVAGVIGENEARHEIVSAPVEGRIDALTMSCEGDRLGRGQPFGNIFSRTLLAIANDFKTALAAGDPAKLSAAQHRLEQCGLAPEQIAAIPQRQPGDLYFGLPSPFAGTIVKSYVSEGQYVKEGERLFELADFTSLWFTFPVYESDLPFVKVDQIVDLTIPSLPGRTVRARITFINPSLDPQTRAATARVLLEHPELHLKINSDAAGVVELDAPEVLAVPRRALLWRGNAPLVYVEKSPGNYAPRAVKLGRTGDDACELLAGLAEGERIVMEGNLLLDAQAQLDEPALAGAETDK